MNKYLLPVVLVFLRFWVTSVLGWSWSFFDPALACVAVFTFFHNMDTRDVIVYALWCGLAGDMLGLDVFGLSMMATSATALGISFGMRFINRQNPQLVFLIVFFSVYGNEAVMLVLRSFFGAGVVTPASFWLWSRVFVEALGTAFLAYPIILFS